MRLEKQLHDIVVGLIVAGERQYRAGQRGYYEWIIERKMQIIEERRQQKEEEERLERERLIRLEKARVKRLLRDAKAMRQAADIRAYVEAVRARCGQERSQLSEEALRTWTERARAEADRIDPFHTNRFLESMKDPEPVQDKGRFMPMWAVPTLTRSSGLRCQTWSHWK